MRLYSELLLLAVVAMVIFLIILSLILQEIRGGIDGFNRKTESFS